MLPNVRRFHSSVMSFRDLDAHIGFIGIGNMGSRMALNLLKCRRNERKLFVFDRKNSTDAYSKLIGAGAISAGSVSEVVKNCRVIFSMLPASQNVRDLYMGQILPALTEQSVLVDCSTIDPVTARSLQTESEKLGHLMIDAPVSGGVKGAEAGTLTFMVGTSLSEYEFLGKEVKSLFQPMGQAVYCGGPGVGQSVKICNNLILGAQMLGVAEGYKLAKRLGVDLGKFNSVVNSSTGQSWSSSKYNPVPGLMDNVPSNSGYEGGFQTDLMVKDLELALEVAKSINTSLPVTEFTRGEYKSASKEGYGALDFGSCYKRYADV